MNWRYVGASVPGTSHLEKGVPCQDTSEIRCMEFAGNEILWAMVSDGAGSAKYGDIGAEVTCHSIANKIERWLRAHAGELNKLDPIVIRKWIERTRKELSHIAEQRQTRIRDYACTLLCSIVAKDCAVYFQLGDGGIVIGQGGEEYIIVFWPENGEYVNTTYFLTDEDSSQRLAIQLLAYSPQTIALFSDGLQRLALHFASRTVFAPFFLPMFQRLSKEPPGRSSPLDQGLKVFLTGEAINRRTDDDKSLVLAIQMPSYPTGSEPN